jgi:hypothetical protein
MVWLGDGDSPGKGWFYNEIGTSGPAGLNKTWQQMLNLTVAVRADMRQGLTFGSYFTPTATTIVADDLANVPGTYVCIRDAMRRWARITGNEYRVTAAGVIESGSPGHLWQATPTVLIAKDIDDVEVALDVVRVNQWDVKSDGSNYADFIYFDNSGGAAAATSGYGFDGATASGIAKYLTSPSTNATDGTNQATNDLTSRYTDKVTVKATVDQFDPSIFTACQPGDYVYLYDERNRLVDTANRVNAGGRQITPTKAYRLVDMNYAVDGTKGVWLAQTWGGTNVVTDVSEWVEVETGGGSLTFSTQPELTLAEAANGYG